MPKTNTKFTAQFTTKLGKTPVEISIPVDLATATEEEIQNLIESVSSQAQEHLSDLASGAKLKFKNQGDLKKAHKAAVKAHEKATAPAE
jgi:hypothetical protein